MSVINDRYTRKHVTEFFYMAHFKSLYQLSAIFLNKNTAANQATNQSQIK